MSWIWAAVPLVAVVSGGTTTEPDEAPPAIGEDQFVANCVDLDGEFESSSLCVVGLDGSIEMLFDGLVPGSQIALSKDRTRIAVPTAEEVVVVDVEGEPVSSVPIANAVGLAWMPDGESVLVQQVTEHEWSIILVTVGAEGEPIDVAAGEVMDESMEPGITVTPDGTTAIYAERVGDNWVLMSVDTESGDSEEIHESSEYIYSPDVSPDGEWVAAVVGKRIALIETATGREIHLISEANQVASPTFSPDGTQIMYVEARGAIEYRDVGEIEFGEVVFDITTGDDESTFPALPAWS